MSWPAADRPESVATDSESSYQLSPIQQGMLFEGLSGQQSGVDIEQVLCSLGEELNVSAFVDAWRQSVDRYPVLRTSFSWLDREVPVQTVHQKVEVPIFDEDWRSLSEDDRARQLATFLQADRLQGFDLTQPPLMRLALFRVAETQYKLIWTYHHILLDSTSAITVLQAVFTLYESLTGDRQLELTPPNGDRDRSAQMQQDISKTEAFWRQYLSGLCDRTPLIGDFSPVGKIANPQENLPSPEIRLSSSVTAALNSLIQEQQLTLNTLLQGVWALLLSRCSGSEDVVFGSICNSRSPNIEKTEPAVGLFI
ncbi:MAG: condensation domain-containing protein, partial [Microcoleus sp.]